MAMLERLRSAGAVRTVVLTAAVLSLTVSAGLHPEPADQARPAATGAALHALALERLAGAAHPCAVCLLQAPAAGVPLPLAPAPPAPPLPSCPTAKVAPPAQPLSPPTVGRAPPALG